MSFAINDVVEIDASNFQVLARVRNVEGLRLHISIEQGYLPWIDEPVVVRRSGDAGVAARILHTSGTTALLEVHQVVAAVSTERLPDTRDTQPDL